MRDLDVINPKNMRPSRFIGVCACVPIILALLSLPLAYGAAPNIPIVENPVAYLPLLVLISSILLAFASLVFKWGWKIKYYGLSLLFGVSISFFAIVPLLSLMLFGVAPMWLKISVLFFYVISHVLWCRKFVILYKNVFENDILRKMIYQEEVDAVYYLQRGDQYLLEKYYKFSQMPRDRHFALFIVLALALTPMMSGVTEFVGIPFAHAFLLVAMVPISWMSFGFAMRGYLVCYSYPSRIKKISGNDVYVDLISMHPLLDKKSLRSNGVEKVKL